MARQSGQSVGGAIAMRIVAIIVIWLVLKLLGVALKLAGLLILLGVGAALFFAVRGRIGGPRA